MRAALRAEWNPLDVPSMADWEDLAAKPQFSDSAPLVDVVVPVFGSAPFTLRCLYSVLVAPQQTRYRLVVIDDASPDEELSRALRQLADLGLIDLHRNTVNQGFPGTCNRGFGLNPDRDVVILNSDTLVYNDWLDRLRRVATTNEAIATVTPLTNNGEICSYPATCRSNDTALELSPADLDALAARVNDGVAADAPTGVGFCMYVTRACLDAVGGFDAVRFGAGYGEENDLCQRAMRVGMRNLVTASVFVWHRGGASFGDSKNERIDNAVRLVEDLHPGYLSSVGAFIEADALGPARTRLDLARLARRSGDAVLMVLHAWGGGTERHVAELCEEIEASGRRALICKPASELDGIFGLSDPTVDNTPNLDAFNIWTSPAEFGATLRRLGVTSVHVHHLIGFHEGTMEFFSGVSNFAGIPYDVTVHDYTPVCPRVNLIDGTGRYCGEPDVDSCQRCVDRFGSPFGKPVVWLWRDRYSRFLAKARTVWVPSEDVATRLHRYFGELHVQVEPHEGDVDSVPTFVRRTRAAEDPAEVRIGIIGAIGPHKGSPLLLETVSAAIHEELPLRFHVIGYTDRDEILSALPPITISGAYEEADLDSLIAEAELDVLWFPAVWPETYSYTLTAALRTNIPIVAFAFGAIAERLTASNRTHVLLPLDSMLDPLRIARCLDSVGRDLDSQSFDFSQV